MDLVESIKQFICAHGPDKKYLLAYSGGLDSYVLLHVFATIRSMHSFQLRAIHVNHGVSSHAVEWAEHCAQVCRELNIELIQQSFSFSSFSEAQLRESRYQLFSNFVEKNTILLTAHHQNDQAETLLLQLCRGAGPQGLAAMPHIKSFGEGFHARPLLDFTRDDLHRYAIDHQLRWVEDESNTNSKLTRNFLRHEVMPLLTQRWPTVTNTFARAAKHCAEAQEFIDVTVQRLLNHTQGRISGTLSVKKLLELNETEQRYVLRAWIYREKYILPSTVKLQQMTKTLLCAREDKMPHVNWGTVEMRRYRDDLFLMPQLMPHDADQVIQWSISQPLTLPNIGVLQTLSVEGQGLRADIENVTVQFRRGGEMLQLPGRKHRHELKKVFQQWGVLPWLRDRVPLIYVDGVLAAVAGQWIADEFMGSQDARIIQLQANPDFARVTD